jgi:hypothetical protein
MLMWTWVSFIPGETPVSFTCRRPASSGVTSTEFDNAYASRWEGRYLSDSRRAFGPLKEATVTDDMQINLHAEHWFN